MHKLLYFNLFSASFHTTFLSARIIIIIIIIITAFGFSPRGSSPYINTHKTNENKVHINETIQKNSTTIPE
jgi:hypothetical protein